MINIRRIEAAQCEEHTICADERGIARAITPDNHEMLASDDLCGILLNAGEQAPICVRRQGRLCSIADRTLLQAKLRNAQKRRNQAGR